MDLAPSLLAYDRDHINDLLAQLTAVDRLVGVNVPKRNLPDGVVSIDLPANRLVEVAHLLRDTLGFEMLTCVTGVDMVDHIESLYHFRSLQHNWLLQARVKLPVENPVVDSLVSLYPSANWLEREQYDLVGITYRGHPDLRRILLEDEFQGHPLLRSFRSTPMVHHDRATTQVSSVQALSGEHTRGQERIVTKRMGGLEERIHPGLPTFGSAAVYLTTGQGVVSLAEQGAPRPVSPTDVPEATIGDEAQAVERERRADRLKEK
ncbi:MAG TPA: NADH-quinone oxidoreductase subunit C [Ktedonobacterales bacterium]|nr:NADH-quinone oxidoreductase subunit C [Ktedonobacterales bacterium]